MCSAFLLLAPKEVIRAVVIHEILHILYPLPKTTELAVRDFIKISCPREEHQEEEWVRCIEGKLSGKVDLPTAWELALEEGGSDWQAIYYIIKKSKLVLRGS